LVEKLIDMKIINIIVVLLFGITSQSIAQTDCKNNVSTNPNSPTNTNLPYLMNDSDELELTGDKYLNRFDWLNTGSIQNHYNSINMMFNSTPYEMNNITSYQSPEYEYISDEIAPLVINGWELLLVNLGYFQNSTDVIPLESADNSALPYIVLYNKYSGVIRVFTNFGEDSDAGEGGNAMEITLKFIETSLFPDVTGLVRLYEGYDRALDQETDVIKMTSIVVKPGQGSHWASTDFQVTYDPCTCFHISKLSLSVKSISVSDVVLNGLSISQTTDLVDANGNLSPNVNDFINGFEDGYSDNDKGGMLIYKNITFAIDEYVKEYESYEDQLELVEEHNSIVNQNLLILKAGKIVIAALKGDVINATLAVVTHPDSTLWTKVEELNKGYATLKADGSKLFDTKKVMKSVKSILGKTGKTFIANNFELKNKPSVPTMPSVTLSEMKYTGTITTSAIAGGVNFYTPGVYESEHVDSIYLESFYEYPVYNDVLGVFALLKTPKFKVYEGNSYNRKHNLFQKTTGYFHNSLNTHFNRLESWDKDYQFVLDENLEYAINDVLDVKNVDIKKAYSIKAKPVLIDTLSMLNSCFQNSDRNINVTSKSSETTDFYPIQTTVFDYNELLAMPNFNSNEIEHNSILKDSIDFQSPYVPVDAFKSLVLGLGMRNVTTNKRSTSNYSFSTLLESGSNYVDGIAVEDIIVDTASSQMHLFLPTFSDYLNEGYKYEFEIELKLIVDIEFNSLNSDGVNNNTTLMLTYDIPANHITTVSTPIVSNLVNSVENIGQYEQNLYYTATHFSGQQVEGCSLVGNDYVCKAWNDITINGDITVANNYTVEFVAGNEVIVDPEAIIYPEVVLRIETLLDYSQPMPKATQTEVTSYCDGFGESPYQANRPTRNAMSIMEAEKLKTKIEKIQNSEIEFIIFPNPTTNKTTIVINDLRTDYVTIQLKDVMGKEIPFDFEQTNSNSYNLDVSNLESGIYFVTVSSYGVQKTKRLVIQ